MNGRKRNCLVVCLLFVCLGCSPRITNLESKGESIVCLGDSLTEGIGADPDSDYPSILRRKVALPVINAGVGGNTSDDALQRIEEDVLDHNPKMVIVMLGGNDLLRKIPVQETVKNTEEIVTQIQANGAMVVLVPLKLGMFMDIYVKEFKAIAREKGALFVPDVMKGILTNPKLKYDQIHPNTDGYCVIAERIYKAIYRYL